MRPKQSIFRGPFYKLAPAKTLARGKVRPYLDPPKWSDRQAESKYVLRIDFFHQQCFTKNSLTYLCICVCRTSCCSCCFVALALAYFWWRSSGKPISTVRGLLAALEAIRVAAGDFACILFLFGRTRNLQYVSCCCQDGGRLSPLID